MKGECKNEKTMDAGADAGTDFYDGGLHAQRGYTGAERGWLRQQHDIAGSKKIRL